MTENNLNSPVQLTKTEKRYHPHLWSLTQQYFDFFHGKYMEGGQKEEHVITYADGSKPWRLVEERSTSKTSPILSHRILKVYFNDTSLFKSESPAYKTPFLTFTIPSKFNPKVPFNSVTINLPHGRNDSGFHTLFLDQDGHITSKITRYSLANIVSSLDGGLKLDSKGDPFRPEFIFDPMGRRHFLRTLAVAGVIGAKLGFIGGFTLGPTDENITVTLNTELQERLKAANLGEFEGFFQESLRISSIFGTTLFPEISSVLSKVINGQLGQDDPQIQALASGWQKERNAQTFIAAAARRSQEIKLVNPQDHNNAKGALDRLIFIFPG